MHHKPFGGRAPPGPAGGAYSAPHRPPSGINGWTSGKGEGMGGRDDVGKNGEGKSGRRVGREKVGRPQECPQDKFLATPM